VLSALGDDTLGLDALQSRCGWPAAELSARLLALELAGRVARLPGGRFQRLDRA
jgi:DNA processing protein